jgi:hypothetical protein
LEDLAQRQRTSLERLRRRHDAAGDAAGRLRREAENIARTGVVSSELANLDSEYVSCLFFLLLFVFFFLLSSFISFCGNANWDDVLPIFHRKKLSFFESLVQELEIQTRRLEEEVKVSLCCVLLVSPSASVLHCLVF